VRIVATFASSLSLLPSFWTTTLAVSISLTSVVMLLTLSHSSLSTILEPRERERLINVSTFWCFHFPSYRPVRKKEIFFEPLWRVSISVLFDFVQRKVAPPRSTHTTYCTVFSMAGRRLRRPIQCHARLNHAVQCNNPAVLSTVHYEFFKILFTTSLSFARFSLLFLLSFTLLIALPCCDITTVCNS
jgi:hypothetical protein